MSLELFIAVFEVRVKEFHLAAVSGDNIGFFGRAMPFVGENQ